MKTKWLFFWPLALAVASCSVYHPQSVDIPLLREKGEVKVDASLSTACNVVPFPSSAGVSSTVSYAANDWLAVQGFADYDFDKGGYLQGAVGAYRPFENSVLEGFLGYGYGMADFEQHSNNKMRIVHGNYQQVFGQLNFGFTDLTRANIDVGLGVKVGDFIPSVNRTEYRYESDDFDYQHQGEVVGQKQFKDPFLFCEPQLFIRMGSEKVKFSIKMGAGISNMENQVDIMDMFNIGAGVTFKL